MSTWTILPAVSFAKNKIVNVLPIVVESKELWIPDELGLKSIGNKKWLVFSLLDFTLKLLFYCI